VSQAGLIPLLAQAFQSDPTPVDQRRGRSEALPPPEPGMIPALLAALKGGWVRALGTDTQRQAAAAKAMPELGVATAGLQRGLTQAETRAKELQALGHATTDPTAADLTPEQLDALIGLAGQFSGSLSRSVFPTPHAGTFTPEELAWVKDLRANPKIGKPDFGRDIKKSFEAGESGKDFYTGLWQDMQKRLPDNPEAARTAIKMQSSSAIGTEPQYQGRVALEAFRRYMLGEPIDASIFKYGVNPATGTQYSSDPRTRGNILNQLHAIVGGGNPSGPKIGTYDFANMGDLDAYTLDRWMNRAHYGKDALTPAQWMLATQGGRDFARKVKMPASQTQAAIWKGIRNPGGEMTGDESMRAIISQALRERPDAFREIPGFQLLDEDTGPALSDMFRR